MSFPIWRRKHRISETVWFLDNKLGTQTIHNILKPHISVPTKLTHLVDYSHVSMPTFLSLHLVLRIHYSNQSTIQSSITSVKQKALLKLMSTYKTVKVLLQSFLTPALDGSEWSAPRCCQFTSAERATGPNCRLDTLEKRKSLVPNRNRGLPRLSGR